MFTIEIDSEKCIGCGECVYICPMEVYELQNGNAVPVNEADCVGCASCIEMCGQEAITVEEIQETVS